MIISSSSSAKPMPRPMVGGVVTLDTWSSHDLGHGRPSPVGALTKALDALGQGLLVTDRSARVIFANKAARAVLASRTLYIEAGCLSAANRCKTRELRDMIARCATHGCPPSLLRLTRPDDDSSVLATIMASDDQGLAPSDDGSTVVIFLSAAKRVPLPTVHALQIQFDLTPAEAALAREVIKGDGIQACADRLSIAVSTARTHLKHVFAKTGTSRQAELVRLILCCTPAHCPRDDRR